jgi:hypothetical protein
MTATTVPPPEKRLKATPSLRTWTISTPGKTPSRSPMATFARTSAFVP